MIVISIKEEWVKGTGLSYSSSIEGHNRGSWQAMRFNVAVLKVEV